MVITVHDTLLITKKQTKTPNGLHCIHVLDNKTNESPRKSWVV